MALASPRVRSTSVEAQEFPELARRYEVSAVPKILLNERVEHSHCRLAPVAEARHVAGEVIAAIQPRATEVRRVDESLPHPHEQVLASGRAGQRRRGRHLREDAESLRLQQKPRGGHRLVEAEGRHHAEPVLVHIATWYS